MKRFFTLAAALILAVSLTVSVLPRAAAEDEKPSIAEALAWAVETAEDETCGYSRYSRRALLANTRLKYWNNKNLLGEKR